MSWSKGSSEDHVAELGLCLNELHGGEQRGLWARNIVGTGRGEGWA